MYKGNKGIKTFSMVLLITTWNSSKIPFNFANRQLAIHKPTTKEKTKADITSTIAGISTVKYGEISSGLVTFSAEVDTTISGNSQEPVPYDKSPANTVSTYAMTTVTSNSLPAPLPISAMAGVTNPIMTNGTKKPNS